MASSDGGDKWNKLVGVGQVVLGTGLVLKGVATFSGRTNGLFDALGRAAQGRPMPQVSPELQQRLVQARAAAAQRLQQQPGHRTGAVLRERFVQVRNIDERVDQIRKLIHTGSTHPKVREAVLDVLTKKCGGQWCVAQKDSIGEVQALYRAVHDPQSPYALRYTRDHRTVDQFAGADKLLQVRGGDCDDYVVLLCSMLRSAGYQTKMRVIHARGAPSWSHIYSLVGVPVSEPTRWIPLDPSVPGAPPGFEAPGAREAAATGRPHGMVERVRDFAV